MHIYKELVENTDVTNPEKILERIGEVLSNNELVAEQKMFALGLLIDKNKESYISILKKQVKDLNQQLCVQKNLIDHYEALNRKRTKENKPVQKKVVVVRKKAI